jgi:hypothetical protein
MPDSRFNLGGVNLTSPDMAFNLGNAMGGVIQQTQGSVQQMKDEKDASGVQVKYDSKKNETSVTGDPAVINALQEDLKAYQQIKRQYADMVSENQRRQNEIKSHPFANTLAQIAAGLAQTATDPNVRGLGVAASRLNPTLPQLREEGRENLAQYQAAVGREAGILGQIESHREATAARQAGQLEAEKNRAAIADENRKSREETARLQRADQFDTKWRDIASKGSFNQQAYQAEYKRVHPEASKEEMEAVSAGYALMAKEAKDAKTELEREKVKARHEARMTELTEQHKQRLEEAGKKGASKGLTGKELTHYQEVEAASGMLDELENAYKSHTDLFNPAWKNPASAVKRVAGKYFDADIQNVTSLYAHSVPIMIKLLAEGARGYAPQQRAWLETKAPKMSDTPEQIQGKLKFIRQYIAADRAGTARAFLLNSGIAEGKITKEQAAKIIQKEAGDQFLSKAYRDGETAPSQGKKSQYPWEK